MIGLQKCRVCGCQHSTACVDPVHGPCWWVEEDLCSHCGEPAIVRAALERAIGTYGWLNKMEGREEQLLLRRLLAALQRASVAPVETFLL